MITVCDSSKSKVLVILKFTNDKGDINLQIQFAKNDKANNLDPQKQKIKILRLVTINISYIFLTQICN